MSTQFCFLVAVFLSLFTSIISFKSLSYSNTLINQYVPIDINRVTTNTALSMAFQTKSYNDKEMNSIKSIRIKKYREIDDNNIISNDKDLSMRHDWLIHYIVLLEFRNQYGHCNVPVNYICECYISNLSRRDRDSERVEESGGDYHYKARLGSWLRIQRLAKKDQICRKLTPQREALLQQLCNDGSFVWDATQYNALNKNKIKSDIEWYRHYTAILHYYEQYGHCNVPAREMYRCTLPGMDTDGGTYEYYSHLGRWLHTQRQAKKGIHSTILQLQPVREALLQKLVDQNKLRW